MNFPFFTHNWHSIYQLLVIATFSSQLVSVPISTNLVLHSDLPILIYWTPTSSLWLKIRFAFANHYFGTAYRNEWFSSYRVQLPFFVISVTTTKTGQCVLTGLYVDLRPTVISDVYQLGGRRGRSPLSSRALFEHLRLCSYIHSSSLTLFHCLSWATGTIVSFHFPFVFLALFQHPTMDALWLC